MTEEKELETYFKGHFLIAMPGLEDPNFIRTVTYLCEHNAEGAVGLVINRVHPEMTLNAIFRGLDLEPVPEADSCRIHEGGPVHPNELFVLHGPPFIWETCRPVTASVALSNSEDVLQEIAKGKGPEAFIITLGCAGWGPGQLEAEIMGNVWLSCPADEKILFAAPPERRWEEAARLMGIDVRLLSAKAGHA